MRLDKFLKVSRIIKRRTISKDIISFGNVMVNNRLAKPSTQIKENDIAVLHLGEKQITIRILSINDKVKKEEALSLYEIIDECDIKSPDKA